MYSANAVQSDDFDINNVENPFTLPKEDVFRLREREKRMKKEEQERQKNLKIWQKTKPSRTGIIQRSKMTTSRIGRRGKPQQERMFQGRRREKENMASFIAKKREMFLIQMSLDTKRQEIQKLEEKAQMKEDALKKSEMMLEEDAMRFDAFLKEHDRKAHDALKEADKETKIKQAKLAQIKKISGQISKVDNEIHKYKKQLEACYKYRNFLLSLTPVEHKQWVAQQKQAKKQERELRRRERRLAREMKNASLGDGDDPNNLNDPNNPAFNPDNPGYAALNDPAYDSEDEDSDDSIDEMYFKRPEQLLEYFSHLEERNLFLIQNVQQDEEALEELKQKFKETEELMEEKTNKLRKTINELNRKIEAENRRAELFNRRTKNNESAGNQQKLLKSLSDRVRWVYNQCSRFNVSHQTDPLDMLMEIERFLEKQLNEIRSMDQAKVTEAEKERESARRLHVRKEKKKEQNRIYLDRMEKSKLRSEAEVFRRVGKQVMFRSAPRKKKTKKEDKTNEKDRQEKEMIESFFKV